MLPITPFLKKNKTKSRTAKPAITIQPAPVLVARPIQNTTANPNVNLPQLPEFTPQYYQEQHQKLQDTYFQILQKALNEIQQDQKLPSQQPLPIIGLTPRELAVKYTQEAAKLAPPAELDLKTAEALAAAEAIEKAGPPPFIPPAEIGNMPDVPKTPAANLPPQFQLNTKPTVANYMAALLGLVKPQAAGQFQAAAIEGNIAQQQADFERRRQYWADTVKADQTAYENAMNQYNAELNQFLTKQQAQDKHQDVRRQYEQLKYSNQLTGMEKKNLAEVLRSLSDRHAQAATAQARAEAAQKVLDIIDKPHTERQQVWKNWIPAVISNLYYLISEPRRYAGIQLGAARHELSQRRLDVMERNMESLINSRNFQNVLKAAGLELQKNQVATTLMNAISQQIRNQSDMLFVNLPPKAQLQLTEAFSKMQQADALEQRINDPNSNAYVLPRKEGQPLKLTPAGQALKKKAQELRNEALTIYVKYYPLLQQAIRQPQIPAGPFTSTPPVDPASLIPRFTLPKPPGTP